MEASAGWSGLSGSGSRGASVCLAPGSGVIDGGQGRSWLDGELEEVALDWLVCIRKACSGQIV